MDYITIVASTYEEAVAKARKEYGNRLRIHSRKDFQKPGLLGLGKSSMCELTCFLSDEDKADEKDGVDLAKSSDITETDVLSDNGDDDLKRFESEAKTPNPDALYKDSSNVASLAFFEQAKKNIENLEKKPEEISEEVKDKTEETPKEEPAQVENKEETEQKEAVNKLLKKVVKLLQMNDFTKNYTDWLVSSIEEIINSALPQLPTDKELEIMVLDKIAESLDIDNRFGQNPERVVAILGPSSAGKTTMVAKMAALFSSVNCAVRRNVRIVLLDDSPAVVGQIQKVGKALNIGVSVAPHETEMTQELAQQFNNELIFVDAVGRPLQNTNPDYRIYGLMNVTNRNESSFIMTIPAPMKNTDIAKVFEQYKSYPLSGLIITKLDETSTVGNVISICHDHNLPIVYFSSGKKIPKDISKASSQAFLRLLVGFNIDINDVLASEQ